MRIRQSAQAAIAVLAMLVLMTPAAQAVTGVNGVGVSGVAGAASPSPAAAGASPTPLLAFYYSWFDVTSWRRAKIDYPELGRYTSDDPVVMRQHIRWAKAAGIDGFIVSWKDTPTNDRRLSLLMSVARSEHFKLAMIYQGLDFRRKALPVERVAADYRYFMTAYASDPVFFRLDGKPLTAWSGTWAYSRADVALVTGQVRNSLLVLNTEKTLKGYQRIAAVTDGDAYYWSSVNPQTNQNYGPKLAELAQAIHAGGKYWMAPFAPGFDARQVGGTKTVERANGDVLRSEYATAVASSPDVLGLISWNEFSENTYVEPSQRYGHHYLDILADLRRTVPPVVAAAADSSEPAGGGSGGWPFHPSSRMLILLAAVVAFFIGVAALRPVVRRRDETLGLLVPPGSHGALPVGDDPPWPAIGSGSDDAITRSSPSLTPERWRHLTEPRGISLPMNSKSHFTSARSSRWSPDGNDATPAPPDRPIDRPIDRL